MNMHQFAAILTGGKYPFDLTREQSAAAKAAGLEHRLANCDADLFKMQQAKESAERRLGEVEAMLRECFAVRFQWPHSAETDAIWIRVAELVKDQPA